MMNEMVFLDLGFRVSMFLFIMLFTVLSAMKEFTPELLVRKVGNKEEGS